MERFGVTVPAVRPMTSYDTVARRDYVPSESPGRRQLVFEFDGNKLQSRTHTVSPYKFVRASPAHTPYDINTGYVVMNTA